ncbi:TetR/AcrR family transcriptional regulator [Actinoplanes sp. CA-142083]|uniref:TetR/AcrR family transcriptional regulator n=1 Tax=Actinoplanes sp. CA-142083 TaxID=3239903 RepID=UPI003D92EF1B
MEQPLRRDARRNVERLTTAAGEVFRERGLDAPLEEIAKAAGVSAGTLYNRFGGRDALIDAVMPDVVEAKVRDAMRRAEAEADPWDGFALYVTLLCELTAGDLAVGDAVSRRYADARRLTEICDAQMDGVRGLIAKAHAAGRLRADFTAEDLPLLLWTTSTVVRATAGTAPEVWRRALAFTLDGLRPAAAMNELPAAPLSPQQVHEVMLAMGTKRQGR